MPMRPLKPCKSPMCPNLIEVGTSYCDEHQKVISKQYDNSRGNFRQRGYTAAWDKVRLIKLKINPLCERCAGLSILTPAKIVHHIISLKSGGSLCNMSNLMSLCVKCHDVIHNEQGDKW
jgi:5-methylcytosine-specific restriction enzyme A